jgi:hypothetical protein
LLLKALKKHIKASNTKSLKAVIVEMENHQEWQMTAVNDKVVYV